MNVAAAQKSLLHIFVAANASQHAQLDLRIVGVHQQTALTRDEKSAHFSAKFFTHRYILHIWLGRTDAPRARFRLLEDAMHPPISVYLLEQAVDVGRGKLGKRAIF